MQICRHQCAATCWKRRAGRASWPLPFVACPQLRKPLSLRAMLRSALTTRGLNCRPLCSPYVRTPATGLVRGSPGTAFVARLVRCALRKTLRDYSVRAKTQPNRGTRRAGPALSSPRSRERANVYGSRPARCATLGQQSGVPRAPSQPETGTEPLVGLHVIDLAPPLAEILQKFFGKSGRARVPSATKKPHSRRAPRTESDLFP